MNCEKCRWYKRTYPVYTFGEFSARCMLGGCDESRYDPRDGKDKGVEVEMFEDEEDVEKCGFEP